MTEITTLPTAKAFDPKDLKKPSRLSDNKGGGEPPMDKDKYVTHEELNHAIDNVNSKIDLSTEKLLHKMDNHFAEMQNQMNRKFTDVDKHFNDIQHELDHHFNEVDKRFYDMQHQLDNRFNDVELKVNDVKNTANNNNKIVNWILYSVIGGIAISILTTIVSNLLTK